MLKKWWIWLIVALVIIGAAVVMLPLFLPRKVQVTGFPPLAYPGFQTWPTPRTFDPPGTVFVLDQDYLDYRASLGIPVRRVGTEDFASLSAHGKWTGSSLADFVGFVSQSIETTSDLE